MLLTLLSFISVVLTATMFATKQSMLGFACVIFWAITGGQAYSLSTAAWDIYFLVAFGCFLGLVPLTAFGAFALREKREAVGEQQMEKGEGDKYIDESKGKESKIDGFEIDEGPIARRNKRRAS